MSIERVILSNLVYDEKFGRRVMPFLKKEYFQDKAERTLFELIRDYAVKYNSFPSKEALAIDLSNRDGIGEGEFTSSKEVLISLARDEHIHEPWLVDETEKFCQDRAIYDAIMKSVAILDDKTGKLARTSIPSLLQDALAISFDSHVGHDLLEDYEARYAYYHRKEAKFEFDIDFMNKATKGGTEKKTLNIISGPTGIGKTTILCHMAANDLRRGRNVVYITLEMAEEKIAQRIEANLLDVLMDDLEIMPLDSYVRKIKKLKDQIHGKLIIKEYPPTAVGAANFRHLLHELATKKNFKADVVYIDYINLCTSGRLKASMSKSYELLKSTAEELRGLAVEADICIWSATQLNRAGFADSDPGLEHTSDSFGLPMTADLMWIVSQSEEMKAQGQILFKQTNKNRYADSDNFQRFVVGINRPRMKLFNVEMSQQNVIGGPTDDRSVFDSTSFGSQEIERSKPKPSFSGFR